MGSRVQLVLVLLLTAALAFVLLDRSTRPDGAEGASARKCSGGKAKCAEARSRWRRVKKSRHRGGGGFSSGERLFAPDSFWNKPVQQRSGLDPRSGELMGALAGFVDRQIRTPTALNGGYPNIGADTYSTPIYRVSRRTPKVKVGLVGDHSPTLRRILAAGVPIPRGAAPAKGTDGHMTVWQPSTDTLWEFWRARRNGSAWVADWAGAMRNVSRSPGHYDARSWGGRPLRLPEGWNWGSTATSLPVAGGTVRLSELRAGRITHALAMAFPNVCRRVFSWPAQRSDGLYSGSDCIPEGAHLRLDPALKLDALPLHPVARLLAEAAQRYGIIVRDRTRVSAQFFLESPDPGRPSPYTGPGGLYRGAPPWRVLEGFPWARLQLLPLSLCTAAPCHQR